MDHVVLKDHDTHAGAGSAAGSSSIRTESTRLQLSMSSLDDLTPNELTLIVAAAMRQRKQKEKRNRKGEEQEENEENNPAHDNEDNENDQDNEDEDHDVNEADEEGIKKLMDAPLPVSASSLTVGAPPEFRVRVLFGLIPKWIYIVGLLFFTMSLEDFADNLADNAERLQEMEFFSGMICDNIDPPPDQCIQGKTRQKTVENLCQGVAIVLMFILSPMIGSLVDTYGRRPTLIFMMVLHAVNHLFTFLRWLIPSVFTYYYVAIWQTLEMSIRFGVTETIVSDVVPPQHRSVFLGVSMAVSQISTLILPQISIHIEPKVAFSSTLALGVAALTVSCLIPETLLEKYHTVKKFSWSAVSPVKSFSMLLRYRILTLLALIMFILGFTLSAAETLVNSPIGYVYPTSAAFQANMDSIVGGLEMMNVTVVQYMLLRYLSQRQVLLFSTVCLLISIIGSATLTAAWQVYLWTVPMAAVGIITPIVAQIISQYVEHEEFGSALTAILTLEKFGEGIGSQLVFPLYLFWSPPPHTHGLSAGGSMRYFPQILFGLICGVMCVMVWQIEAPSEGEKVDYRREKKKHDREVAAEKEAEGAAVVVTQANMHLLGSSSMSINGGGSDTSAVAVHMSSMSSMHELLLDPAEQDQI